MKNIKLIVEYDGSSFHGFQRQLGLRTVEGELKKALDQATGEDIQIIPAGRTDRGVHALGQVVNFKTTRDIPGENYKRLMDFLLPGDISIKDSCEVDLSFHSRFDAKWRRYRYVIYNRQLPNAVVRKNSYFYPYKVDLDLMNEGAKYFIGEKDFTAFKLSENIEVNPIREIRELSFKREGNFIIMDIMGNAFLHNMVRIMAGTLLYVGGGRISLAELEQIIEKRDRKHPGITAGSEGLYLMEVIY